MKVNDTRQALEAALQAVSDVQHKYNEFLAHVDRLHSIPALEEAAPRLRELQKNLNELYAGMPEQSVLDGTQIHLMNELVEYLSATSTKIKELLQYEINFFLQITPWMDVKLEALRAEIRELILKERPSFPDLNPAAFDAERFRVELEELRNRLGSAESEPASNDFPLTEGVRSSAFASLFRGDREWLMERWKSYLHYFKSGPEPVLDIGCGKGEFLELMKAEGIEAYGIELNPYEVQQLIAKGLKGVPEDAISYLEKQSVETIGGVFCAQVVEHLAPEQVHRLLSRLHSTMKPGAALVVETVNPVSVFALHNVYFKDPTHIFPVHPETLVYLFRYAGFRNVQVRTLSPIPDPQKLQPPSEIQDPALRSYLERIVSRLNEVIFNDLEYFVVGYR